MIYALLKKLCKELRDQVEIPCLLEPSLVEPDEPHLRVTAGSVLLERLNDQAIREWDGNLYTAHLYRVRTPLALGLTAKGQEEPIKKTLYDASLLVSLFFDTPKTLTAQATKVWPGSFTVEMYSVENEVPITGEEEGQMPYRFGQTWRGEAVCDYYRVLEQTERAAEFLWNEEGK